MNIEKRGNSYRARKMVNGKTKYVTFDHKPTDAEVLKAFEDILWQKEKDRFPFETYANKYIDSKRNVLSPSSITTYERLLNVISREFLDTPLLEMTQFDVQNEINRYAETHAPKTVKSLHGFIASVIGLFRPDFVLRTTLPQAIKRERYTPTNEDIKAILEAAEGSADYIGIYLGVYGLRRGEVCALTLDDLEGTALHIHSTMVWNKGWIKKENPKTDESNRIIYISEELANIIREKECFFPYSPNKLLEHLNKYQDDLGIPRFRFHDLRHYFASYAATIMPESDAMALGGWKSDHIFKRIYRESMEDSRKKSAELFNQNLLKKEDLPKKKRG